MEFQETRNVHNSFESVFVPQGSFYLGKVIELVQARLYTIVLISPEIQSVFHQYRYRYNPILFYTGRRHERSHT